MPPADHVFLQPWDLFCRVIDNHGDLGVAVRLARQLNALGVRVRLWVDDASALAWMAPDLPRVATVSASAAATADAGTQVLPWSLAEQLPAHAPLPMASVWVELFGCDLPEAFVAHGVQHAAANRVPVWLNLEYLSAEAYVERCHGLPSPVHTGPARGWTKWFFYPGFTAATGGLLRADASEHACTRSPDTDAAGRLRLRTNLFCYEPPGLAGWLATMQNSRDLALDWQLMPGRPVAAFVAAWNRLYGADPLPALTVGQWVALPHSAHRVCERPYCSQPAFDAALADADLNFVRGEDSLVSALRAGKPFVWHIYPQEDNAHHAKLHAFLDWLQAPASLRALHEAWNGVRPVAMPALTRQLWDEWAACARAAQARLAAQPDLCSQLMRFVHEKRTHAAHA